MGLNRVTSENFGFRQTRLDKAGQDYLRRTSPLPSAMEQEEFVFFPEHWVLNHQIFAHEDRGFYGLVRAAMHEIGAHKGITVVEGMGGLAVGTIIGHDPTAGLESHFQHDAVKLVQSTNEWLNSARSAYEVEIFTPNTPPFGGTGNMRGE